MGLVGELFFVSVHSNTLTQTLRLSIDFIIALVHMDVHSAEGYLWSILNANPKKGNTHYEKVKMCERYKSLPTTTELHIFCLINIWDSNALGHTPIQNCLYILHTWM